MSENILSPKTTSWGSPSVHTKIPTEKLVKDSLDSLSLELSSAIDDINNNYNELINITDELSSAIDNIEVFANDQRGLPVDNLVGVSEATRYVGTSFGPPVSGTFQKGDFIIDPDWNEWTGTTLPNFQLPIHIISNNTTLGSSHYTVLVNAISGNIIIGLPTAVGLTGKIYNIKKIDSSTNTVTIQSFGTQTIDGDNTKIITEQYTSVNIQSLDSNWYII